MVEACNGCRSWEEDIYWSHFQSKHFIQYLHSGFDQQLAIPEKVTRNLKRKLEETVSLKGPSGNTWSVGITAHNDTFFFNHGWPEFAKDHFLEESDILIFKYNGVSHFDVLIFDGRSQCEKASAYFVRKCSRTDHGSGSQTKRRESSLEDIPNSSDCDVEVTRPSEKTANNDIENVPGKQVVSLASTKRFRTGDGSARAVCSWHTVRKALFTSTDEVDEKPDIEHMALNGNGASSPHHVSDGRLVTEDQKRNALLLAQAALTADGFLAVMRPTSVYRKFYMTIPAAWSTKYLMGETQDIILRSNEKIWNTRYVFWKPRSCGGLSSGWRKFAFDNKLDEFDVCVFSPERLEVKPIILNVSIFKVLNEVAPLTQVAPSP